MGTRGHGALATLLVGSVAERTVLTAPCPVLLVPEAQALFEGWNADRPLRLLVGFDLDSGGNAVLTSVEDLRRAGSCEVTLVHTYWPPAEYARLGLPGSKDLFATDPEVANVLEREIRSRLGLRGLPPRPRSGSKPPGAPFATPSPATPRKMAPTSSWSGRASRTGGSA